MYFRSRVRQEAGCTKGGQRYPQDSDFVNAKGREKRCVVDTKNVKPQRV